MADDTLQAQGYTKRHATASEAPGARWYYNERGLYWLGSNSSASLRFYGTTRDAGASNSVYVPGTGVDADQWKSARNVFQVQ